MSESVCSLKRERERRECVYVIELRVRKGWRGGGRGEGCRLT